MIKERLKTILIILLVANSLFLTYESWFNKSLAGQELFKVDWESTPLYRLFSNKKEISLPKENLSKPRKIVINDGALWVPYYNTDSAFDNLDEKTSAMLKSCLSGKAEKVKSISYEKWLENLNRISIYVEYPIAVSPKMLANILSTTSSDIPLGLNRIRDAIIIPEGEEGVTVAIRDEASDKAWQFYIKDENLAFPEAALMLFTQEESRDGYYEFAYNTLIGEGMGEGRVTVGDLVLFSDNATAVSDIYAYNPLSGSYSALLESFSFNPNPIRRYKDDFGGENYVENYATVRIFPDGYVDFGTVKDDKGIEIESDTTNGYEVLNSAIDFVEKVWQSVSDRPLNVLVSGVDETEVGTKITFDYYCEGKEVAISYNKAGREPLYHAIEIIVEEGKITSYRQYFRCYDAGDTKTEQESFITALDYYVALFGEEEGTVITDMYPGYYDGGGNGVKKTTWLCEKNYGDEKYPKK